MRNPLFYVGEKVLHRTTGKMGVITAFFADGGSYRYYVRHSHYIWSVPESSLDSKDARFGTEENQDVSGAKILKFARHAKKSGSA